jgi:hypothetical protein
MYNGIEIECLLDRYLADTGKTLESLTGGGESGLLPALVRQVSDASISAA